MSRYVFIKPCMNNFSLLFSTRSVNNEYLMHDDSLSLSDEYLFSLSSISQENDQHVRYTYAFGMLTYLF
jgi:hypothetical protein